MSGCFSPAETDIAQFAPCPILPPRASRIGLSFFHGRPCLRLCCVCARLPPKVVASSQCAVANESGPAAELLNQSLVFQSCASVAQQNLDFPGLASWAAIPCLACAFSAHRQAASRESQAKDDRLDQFHCVSEPGKRKESTRILARRESGGVSAGSGWPKTEEASPSPVTLARWQGEGTSPDMPPAKEIALRHLPPMAR